MAGEQTSKPSYNSTFKEIKKWKSSETKEQYIVLSLITNNDTGSKSLFINKQWKTQEGKFGTGKGVTIPVPLGAEIGDSLKIASASEGSN